MKARIFQMGLLAATMALIGAALYRNGSYVVYMLTYIFFFVFLLCSTVPAASATRKKVVQVIVYALILAAQILFAVLIIRPASDIEQGVDLCRLSGVMITLVPFLIKSRGN